MTTGVLHGPPTLVARQSGHGFNKGVNGLRGIASLAVVLAHVIGGLARHVYGDETGYPQAIAPFWNFGVYFVYIFFAISGFVILPTALRYRPGAFAWRRFVRIYPLFLVATVVFIILNALTDRHVALADPATILFALTFTNLFFGTEQLTPNAWSLSFEAVFYALACAGTAAWIRGSHLFGAVVALASLAFLLAFPGAVYFLIGMGVFVLHRHGVVRAVPFRNAAELVALLVLSYVASRQFFAYAPADMLNGWAQLTVLFTALYFLMAVEGDSLTARLLSVRAAQYMGTISYSLYLVHPYFYLPARLVFVRLGLFGENQLLATTMFGVVVVAGSVLLAHLSFRVFERFPQRWVRGEKPSHPAVAEPAFSGRVAVPGERGSSGRTWCGPVCGVATRLAFWPGPGPIPVGWRRSGRKSSFCTRAVTMRMRCRRHVPNCGPRRSSTLAIPIASRRQDRR
jgi:peptidoglycan/LPS O-acetylase OafA/YrhL